MTHTLKKVVQHKEEYIFLNGVKEAQRSGYRIEGERKLTAAGVWQQLMIKEVPQNPNYNPNKPRGWGQQNRY